jgi:hypothetical protein
VDDIVAANIITASNGLTKTGNDIQLGGALENDTWITTAKNKELFIGRPGDTYLRISGGSFYTVDVAAQTSAIYKSEGMSFSNDNTLAQLSMLYSNDDSLEIEASNSGIFKGLVYADDYSANYTNRSLVDKEYVDGLHTTLWDIDHDTGIQVEESADEDIIRFDTNGLEQMVINNLGAVGIGGTPIPGDKLFVNGDIRIRNGGFLYATGPGTLHIGDNNDTLNFLNNRAVMTNSGEWGMGTMTPASILHADSNDVNTNAILTLENTAGDMQVFRTDATPENAVTGSIGDLAIDGTNGNLYIKHTGNATNTGWTALGSGGGSPASNDGAIQYNNGGSFGGDSSNFFWDDTNNRLGLGTNNPGYQLTLVGDGTSGDKGSIELATYADAGAPSGIYLHRSRGTEAAPTAITSGLPLGGVVVGGYDGTSMVAYAGGIQMESTENWSNTGHGNKLFFSTTEDATTGMTQRMVIMDNGDIGIGISIPTAQLHTTGTVRFSNFGAGTMQTDANGNVSVSSDERLKNVQGVFNRGLEELLSINPIEYKWKEETGYDTENSYYGFSAQNVKLSIPEAVGEDGRGYLTLSDRPILATAINAIKELNQKQEEAELAITSNTLKTDTNVNTLTELQVSIDSNLAIINNSLTNLGTKLDNNTKEIKDNKKDLETLSKNINSLTELTTTLTDTVANHEERIAQIEAIIEEGGMELDNSSNSELPEVLTTFADNLEVLKEDGNVEFTLDGRLIVGEIKTGALEAEEITTNKIIVKNDTVGTAKIKEGETSVKIKTSAVDKNSHIILTPHEAIAVGLADIEDNEGFTIKINEALNEKLEIEWFIIQENK